MKVSTQYFYEKSLSNLQKAQSEASKSNEQLSTGKSLVRPSDDTLKLRTVANLNRSITSLENFSGNVEHLLNRLSLEESVVLSASDATVRIKELAIQASNATYSQDDRRIMASEVESLREHLLSLANSRDANGSAIFGGSRTESEPFVESDDGRIRYQGDDQVMRVEVADGRSLAKNRAGLQVFASTRRIDEEGEVKSVGFFDVIDDLVESLNNPKKTQIVIPPNGLSDENGALVINGVEISKEGDRPDIAGITELINNESDRTKVVASQDEEGNLVIENLDGYKGETIIFGEAPGLFKDISGVLNPLAESRLWERSISEVGALHDSLSLAVGSLGSEISSAEYQKELNLNAEIRLKQLKSSEVDVDFAEVVSRFNAELSRLEASQAAFGKLTRLSLFEYL
tara:strand:+ start:2549 stop:3751 length:1203 start_codon:yes stop_codon:yes gene_type:complete